MKFRFERSRRVYNRVSKPEPSILEFSFFLLFFPLSLSPHHLSPRSLFSLPFLPPARSSPARPSAVRCSSGPSTLRRISPGLAQPRSERGGSQIARPGHAPAQAPDAPAAQADAHQATPTGPQQATDLPCQHELAFARAPTCRNPHLVMRLPSILATMSAEVT